MSAESGFDVGVFLKHLFDIEGLTEKGKQIRDKIAKALRAHFESPNDPVRKRTLTAFYWEGVEFILERAIKRPSEQGITFEPLEKLFLDFGFTSDAIFSGSRGGKEKLASFDLSFASGDIRVMSLSEWLGRRILSFGGYDEIGRSENLIAEKEQEISRASEKLEALLEERDGFLGFLLRTREIGPEIPEKLYKLNRAIDTLLPEVVSLRFRIQKGQPLNQVERQQMLTLENNLEKLKRETGNVLSFAGIELARIQEVSAYWKKMENVIQEKLELEFSLACEADGLKKLLGRKQTLTDVEKRDFLMNVYREYRTMSELCAKRARLEPFPVLSDIPLELSGAKIHEIISDCIKNDPEIFKNKMVKRKGKPLVVVIPACGVGVFSFDSNTLMIPVTPARSLKESVIHALVLYRWDVDEDRELRDSFSEIKEYRHLSFLLLQQALFKDYLAYQTRECQGYRVLPKEVREWFEWKIAPRKEKQETPAQTRGEEKELVSEEARMDGRDETEAWNKTEGDERLCAESMPDETPPVSSEESAEGPGGEDAGGIISFGDEGVVEITAPGNISETSRGAGETGGTDRKEDRPETVLQVPEKKEVSGGEEISQKNEKGEAVKTTEFQLSREIPSQAWGEGRETIYARLRELLKIADIEKKVEILPGSRPGRVTILMKDLEIITGEIETYLNALLIQAKLRRFNPLK